VLGHLSIDEPADWLGNAWGGHVGILFAATHPHRCRTLLAVGAPVHALTAPERRKIRLLATLYRVAGPRPVIRPLVDALVGSGARMDDPEGAAVVAQAFKRAGRPGMYDAIRWLSLTRADLAPVLAVLETPTVLTTATDDPMWTIPAARAATASLPNGALVVLPGSGHVGPLFQSAPEVADLVLEFWRDPRAVIAAHQPQSSAR
jgi:pimeloyl-ACP methyl ester carboxylesterase